MHGEMIKIWIYLFHPALFSNTAICKYLLYLVPQLALAETANITCSKLDLIFFLIPVHVSDY